MRRILWLIPMFLGAVSIADSASAAPVYDANLTSPGFYNGSGNTSDHFTVSNDGGIEVGLRATERFVGSIAPDTGTGTYHVPLGLASSRAKWNWDFSINLRPGNIGTLTLNDITAILTFKDVLNGTTGTLNLFSIPDNPGFGPSGEDAKALSTDWGMQNSENLMFSDIKAALDPLFDADLNNTYLLALDVDCISTACARGDLANVSATFIAGAGATSVPEPGTLAMLAPALFGTIGFVGRRRRKLSGSARAAA